MIPLLKPILLERIVLENDMATHTETPTLPIIVILGRSSPVTSEICI